MAEAEDVRFACIGCGALNPPGAEVCTGCGHRFAGPDVLSAPAAPASAPAPRDLPVPPDPYRPPTVRSRPQSARVKPPPAFVPPAPTIRIGTAMALIAVIALCLAAFAANPFLGGFATLGLVPAMIRTSLVSGRREAEGRAPGLGEKIGIFLVTGSISLLTAVASMIAFVMTCVPVGLASMGNPYGDAPWLAIVAGVAAGLGVAFLIIRMCLRIARKHEERRRDLDSMRWR